MECSSYKPNKKPKKNSPISDLVRYIIVALIHRSFILSKLCLSFSIEKPFYLVINSTYIYKKKDLYMVVVPS